MARKQATLPTFSRFFTRRIFRKIPCGAAFPWNDAVQKQKTAPRSIAERGASYCFFVSCLLASLFQRLTTQWRAGTYGIIKTEKTFCHNKRDAHEPKNGVPRGGGFHRPFSSFFLLGGGWKTNP